MVNLDDELRQLNPVPTTLLRSIAAQIDDDMLREIAEADYGQDADVHLAALRHIRDFLEIPTPLAWEPKEVLELVRWSEPDDPQWGSGGHGMRGHLMRAFCCTALLLAATAPENAGTILSENETIIQLTLSAMALGADACNRAVELLAWRLLRDPYDEVERPFFAFALILLRTRLYRPGARTSDLMALCEWTRAEEARLRVHAARYGTPPKDDWLLGLVFHDQRHSAWQSAGANCLANPPRAMPEQVRAELEAIGDLLCRPSTSSTG